MSNNKKQILSRLMGLDNPKVDKLLVKFAQDIFVDIKKSKDNESIFEALNLVNEFIYKAPKETIKIVSYIFGKKPILPTIHKSKFGELEGKSHKDLILKDIEFLDHLRYIVPDEVLKLAAQLSLDEDSAIKGKALEVVKKFSQYDYNILTKSKLGYSVQRKALDFIKVWPRNKQLQHIEFVEVVLKELLNLSIEGTTSGLNEEVQYTITLHSGVVSPTDFLKKMRKEAIDLTYELYRVTGDLGLKLKLIGIFDEASRTPSNVLYGDDVAQMITNDLKYLVSIYRKIIFGEKKDKMTNHLGIVATIEERLYWINKSEKKRVEESEKLRNDILHNDLYKIFRLLVGDLVTYREEEDWDTAEKKRNEEIDKLIDSIQETQFKEWVDKFDKITSQQTIVDDWKFNIFRGFIRKLSKVKPQIADQLLNDAFKNNSSLKNFIGSFLDGFRAGPHFDFWDKYVSKIIRAKNAQFVSTIVYSLNLWDEADLEKFIRNDDIDLLKEIIKKRGDFAFLKDTDEIMLHHALINTLLRNFKRSSKDIESLIVEEIENNPKYLNMFLQQLPMMLWKKWIDVKELQPKTVKLFRNLLVKIPDIDWHAQGLLLAIGQRDGLDAILDVFMERIIKDKGYGNKLLRKERYESIPYHFNPDLQQFISNHSEYEEKMSSWIAKMTKDWSVYNWHVGNFIQRIGKGFSEIIRKTIEKGGDENLMKAARIIHSIDGSGIDLCIEIIRRTDNKKIINQVDSNIYTTGVVSGEYGIAQAYENKAKELEKYKTDESEGVRKFAERMMGSLLDSAKRERQHTDEEKQLRKIEFEG